MHATIPYSPPAAFGLPLIDGTPPTRARLDIFKEATRDLIQMRNDGAINADAFEAAMQIVTVSFVGNEISDRVEQAIGDAFTHLRPKRWSL